MIQKLHTLNKKHIPHKLSLLIILAEVVFFLGIFTFYAVSIQLALPANRYLRTTVQAANEVSFYDNSGNAITQTSSPTVNVKLTSPWPAQAQPAAASVQAAASYAIYSDALVNGWTNASYKATVNYNITSPVYSGTRSISLKANAYGALSMNAPAGFTTNGYTHIQLAMRATAANEDFGIYLENANFSPLKNTISLTKYGGYPSTTGWTVYTVSLADLNGVNKGLGDVSIQNNTNKALPLVYVDQIQFINNATPATPTPTQRPIPTLTATPTPASQFTASAVLAEDANFTTYIKTISPYPSNPYTTSYTFSNSTPGTKTLYVKFTSTTGQTQTYSGSIKLVNPTTPLLTPTSSPSSGLRVSGNRLVDNGTVVRLLGVNRSGTQYSCIQNAGIFDGPNDDASIQAIKNWNANAIRVSLNEHCWLGKTYINAAYRGQNYINAIADYVNRATALGMYVIVDNHWSAPNNQQAIEQAPMPDRDNANAFWQSVADTFKSNNKVIFDLFNEPYPDNESTSIAAWTCWRDGGICSGVPFVAAGMQEMLNAVRGTGAKNLVIANGVNWANDVSRWLEYKPNDPENNLAVGWHNYQDGLSCTAQTCWNQYVDPLGQQYPIITNEIGQFDCKNDKVETLMNWLDARGHSYLAWGWVPSNCSKEPALITNFNGSPTQTYGQGIKDHFMRFP